MRHLLSVLILGAALPLSAQAVTVHLKAAITDIGQNFFGGGVVDRFSLGEEIEFSFNYTPDDSAAAVDDNGMKYVVTDFTLHTAAYTGTVYNRGAIKFSAPPAPDEFQMYSGVEDLTDGYGVPIAGVPLLDGYYLSSLGFYVVTQPGVFTSDSLNQPLLAYESGSFNFHFAFREPGTTRAMGTMQARTLLQLSSSISPVPEPASALSAAVGLLFVGLCAIRVRGRQPAGRPAA